MVRCCVTPGSIHPVHRPHLRDQVSACKGFLRAAPTLTVFSVQIFWSLAPDGCNGLSIECLHPGKGDWRAVCGDLQSLLEVFLVLKAGFRKHSWKVRGRGDCPVGEVTGMGDLGFHLCCFSAFLLRVSREPMDHSFVDIHVATRTETS